MFFRQSQSSSTKAKHGWEAEAKKPASGAEGADVDRLHVPLSVSYMRVKQWVAAVPVVKVARTEEHVYLLMEDLKLLSTMMNIFAFSSSLFPYNYCNCYLQLFQVLREATQSGTFFSL